jgi:hypothetical protein
MEIAGFNAELGRLFHVNCSIGCATQDPGYRCGDAGIATNDVEGRGRYFFYIESIFA